MTTTARRRVFALAVTFAAIAGGALAAPAAADAGVTRYVDDDGLAAKNGCDGSRTVAASIQAAVDVSAPLDTIIVCPGTYPETVDVNVPDLTIRGASRWTATVNPKTSAIGAIVRVSADDVRIQWLKVLGRTTGSCSLFPAGIQVNGVDGATIISNRVVVSDKGDARSGPCGIQSAIHVATGGQALIRYNLLRDWRLQGVWLQSADTGTAVKDNSVRYWHPDVCTASIACRRLPGPAVGATPIGIHVHNTTAVVTNNAISSAAGASLNVLVRVDRGIRVNASTGVLVKGNRIVRSYQFAIELNNVTGSRIVENTLTDGVAGLYLQSASSGNTVRGNTVTTYSTRGIDVLAGSTGNTFRGNTSTGSAWEDCRDQAIGNTWVDNVGDDSDPVGICSPA
jgi:parallel beta-helix repeat protein